MQLTPGGMLLKRTREAIRIVRSSNGSLHTSLLTTILLPVAIQALSQTITHLTQAGRFRQAADREKEIAQIYLQEQNDLRHACESFQRAGEWYAQEDATAYVVCSSVFLGAFIITNLLQYCQRLLQRCGGPSC